MSTPFPPNSISRVSVVNGQWGLPSGGQWNCPLAANRIARSSVGEWRYPLSGGGLGVARGPSGAGWALLGFSFKYRIFCSIYCSFGNVEYIMMSHGCRCERRRAAGRGSLRVRAEAAAGLREGRRL